VEILPTIVFQGHVKLVIQLELLFSSYKTNGLPLEEILIARSFFIHKQNGAIKDNYLY
jgi:hypothetical protein